MVNRYDTHEVMGMIRDDDGLYVLHDDYAALEAENARLKADMAEAAGEFLVPMPEPGTPTAKLLAANVLLRRENARLAAESHASHERGVRRVRDYLRSINRHAAAHMVEREFDLGAEAAAEEAGQ